MGRLYRRHAEGTWYGDYYTPEGKRIQRSLRTTNRAVAKERLRLAELGASPQARGRRQRLIDAIDDMIATLHDKAEATREFYREKGRRVLKSLGNPFIHDVNRDMLAGYIKLRLSDDVEHGRAKPHTVKKELITIRRALREAFDRGVLAAMPAMPRFSPKYVPRETWLTPEQFEQVVAELPEKRQLWAAVAALAGGSLSEVERVDWATIELDRPFESVVTSDGKPLGYGRMLIPGTKRETRRRWVPIADALRHRLLQVKEPQRRGRLVQRWPNVRRDLHSAVLRANARAQLEATRSGAPAPPTIPNVSPNDLRRTFASWLVQAGVPTLVVASLMGHSSTRMVELVYGKLARANLDAAIAKLPSLRGPPTTPPVTDGVTTQGLLPTTRDHSGDDSADPD